MDLTLPPTAPQLGRYNRHDWTISSFAIYTLVHIEEQFLQDLAFRIQGNWYEDGGGGEPLVRPAPHHDFAGKSLEEVIQAHISLMENDASRIRVYDEFFDGFLYWFPVAFIVVTSVDIGKDGLLFVYADPYDEVVNCPLERFYFRVEDARIMLWDLREGYEACTAAKEEYAIGTANPS